MPIWASIEDVQDIYEAEVPERAEKLLDAAETLLKAHVKALAARIALLSTDADYLDPKLVTKVLVDAVIRVLRNPRGYAWEREGSYSYGLPIGVKGEASGGVWFLPEELDLLASSTPVLRVGTIALADPFRTPRSRRYPEPRLDVWSDDPQRIAP